jgi:hypothetical protein
VVSLAVGWLWFAAANCVCAVSFDWPQFLQTHGIEYIERGPNVARGNIALHCPWCGIGDDSHHLSLNLAGKGFRCWRSPSTHVGKNPAKLIQALLGCSWEQANSYAGQRIIRTEGFLDRVRKKAKKVETASKLTLPKDFKTFMHRPSCRLHIEYLRKRGFTEEDIFEKTKEYGIYYTSLGDFKGRIIFTIQHQGELVGWTGRSIYPFETLRYKTLSHDTEKAKERGEPVAPNPIGHYLLFHDRLQGGDTIVLCEGPFDAWRVNLLGESEGIAATCFFTSMLSQQQMELLHSILPLYKRRILLLDEGTFAKAARIKRDLRVLDVDSRRMPDGIKDPAELRNIKDMLAILR